MGLKKKNTPFVWGAVHKIVSRIFALKRMKSGGGVWVLVLVLVGGVWACVRARLETIRIINRAYVTVVV